jgi:hypothetical protein
MLKIQIEEFFIFLNTYASLAEQTAFSKHHTVGVKKWYHENEKIKEEILPFCHFYNQKSVKNR